MNSNLDSRTVLRISADHRRLIDSIPDLDGFYLQGRNRGGGLGKRIHRLEPIVVDGLEFAFDPDAGVGFSREGLVAVHAGCVEAGRFATPVLDFEFDGFPAGLSFHEFPDMSAPGTIGSLVDRLGANELPEEDLRSWRGQLARPRQMCPCCRRRSEERAERAEHHPLCAIFRHAMKARTVLECRMMADHLDLTATLAPSCLTIQQGYLVIANPEHDCALHVDMRMVHALAIDVEELDGSDYAVLRLFDMHGSSNFQLMSEDPLDVVTWRRFCEGAGEASDHPDFRD